MLHHSDDIQHSQKMGIIDEIDYAAVKSIARSALLDFSYKLDEKPESIIDLDSSPVKDTTEDESEDKLKQPLEKVQDLIQKTKELKNDLLKEKIDEQNKENLENNEINLQNCKNLETPKEENKTIKDEIDTTCKKEIDNNKTDEKNTKPLDDTVITTDETLDLMDVSECNNITNNNKDKNQIKDEVNDDNDDDENDKTVKNRGVDNSNLENKIDNENNKTTTSNLQSRKRLRSIDDTNIGITSTPYTNHIDQINDEQIHPKKKLRSELETNFRTHDRILSEYIERTSNDSPDDIDKHISQLAIEIQTLNDMIKDKEAEWNNMLHLKKVKEEICFRLTRKKQVMEIMATKVGDINTTSNIMPSIEQNLLGEKISLVSHLKIPNLSNQLSSSSALAAMAAASSNLLHYSHNKINESGGNSGSSSATQSILQLRANMKSADLAKEKANTQKLHRLLVSRNILPKPSTTMSTPPSIGISGGAGVSGGGNITGFGGATSQLGIGGLFGSATAPVVISTSTSGGNAAIQIPLPNVVATGSLMSAHTPTNNGLSMHQHHQQQQPILNNYLTAAASVQQQLGELFNGHHNNNETNSQNGQNVMVGRQGVFKDVKSIIADYRQKNPEQVPRRGRRMKSTNSNEVSGGLNRNNSELNSLLSRFEGNSRPSSNDSSSHSMNNVAAVVANFVGAGGGNISFKDALVQFVKMSGQPIDRLGATAGMGASAATTTSTQGNKNIGSNNNQMPFPEVTLHPVSTTNSVAEQTGSLLHGILTKYSRGSSSHLSRPTSSPIATSASSCAPTSTTTNYSTFSPTLARLLTAPERITNNINALQNNIGGSHAHTSTPNSSSSGINLSKVVGHNSEITITPVVNSGNQQPHLMHSSLLQQQIKDALNISKCSTGSDRIKSENYMNMDDEADDSVDRLVIDEGGGGDSIEEMHRIAPNAIGQEFHENEVPWCQGCKKQEAQFVCAGCGSQWYCSRECQVQAWDDHSETCTG